jgi:hypothetical protein
MLSTQKASHLWRQREFFVRREASIQLGSSK